MPNRLSHETSPYLRQHADYMNSLATYGASFYRNLFWEVGTHSTGIGC